MRYITNLLTAAWIALFFGVSAQAQIISPQEATDYIESNVTVEGVVSQVSTSNNGTTFINFGGRFPNHVFYAVIFRKNLHQFSNVRALEGRALAVSGKIQLYKGKPQIILYSPTQIEMR
ncbi:nucleotide-binding protein [Sulfitobacter pseudonitzschiae]|uniref:Nucleotide-binding protein n=1 Tax=Pseudosulfitobacter pseudonitzschiae TaxID=1402135 RepID=A0A9Q2P4Q0_9RHOB|nr:nucleotide-binding protein [Pseudosulfitobacter pseudonitzschiae]MBM2294366.1 nucleotide-binding protein [Pseudosulfitobacter pseudonitzschiae]MBM2299291.1 nucleotide-binding protein [Pseudosulfitobacter pseudonitzschiae]MBM2304198.1 nucleotide-binding protein [Pseudosulfitobacter pseudonitzschiae]MBM2313978.1 nucleotide-binding protein [Pseudosulfitobacter pseudonitzschiae]MBM2318893.1 nucleotide-binding protein [Pseudosulfitobacter pseudonitzschiae]